MQNCVTRDQVYLIEKRFSNYANVQEVQALRDDLNDKASKEDIAVMASRNEEIQKNVSKFATVQEVRGRLEVVTADINKKLSTRPTLELFRSTLSKYDEKIYDCVQNNTQNKE